MSKSTYNSYLICNHPTQVDVYLNGLPLIKFNKEPNTIEIKGDPRNFVHYKEMLREVIDLIERTEQEMNKTS